jgi:hypothetical protein
MLPLMASPSQPNALAPWLHVARTVHCAAEAASGRAPAGSDKLLLLRVARAAAYRATAGHLGLRAVLPPGIRLECAKRPLYKLHIPRHCSMDSSCRTVDGVDAPCEAVIRAHMAVVYAHLIPVVGTRKSDPALWHAWIAAVRMP